MQKNLYSFRATDYTECIQRIRLVKRQISEFKFRETRHGKNC
jgi:hypothetical protein